jgi:DNA-binding IscR family transcriptional regulator
MTARELALATGIPLRLVQQTASDLVAAGILSTTPSRAPDQPAFQPAMDIRLLNLQRVSEALESPKGLTDLLPQTSNPEAAALREALRKYSQAAAESPANRLLSDL